MSKEDIKQLIAQRAVQEGLTETGISGVQLFRATQAIPCVPVVYDPCIVAIVSGTKEAVFDGQRHVYGDGQYLCCPVSMPIKAGTPEASLATPLFGVLISLDQRIMAELILEMDNSGAHSAASHRIPPNQSIGLARWDNSFTEALLRVLQLGDSKTDTAILGASRLRELHYAILKGEAGEFARQSFGPGNAIARSIAHVSSNLGTAISIEDMADRAGMSRAVFHRKFKQMTTLSPIQFVKAMRLNNAAMMVAGGTSINEAAFEVGYVSLSQFSREFKRMYGQSPRQWAETQKSATGLRLQREI
ncbi:Transposon Tn10 TetD protein [Pelagimonas phthalicica]|uniref:Transposon Tn10 TetD protein n=1 Tax=Pelagimonas phthalicica TaxID=1037362 RepID=A0A238J971_9RHOB|nr:AraC family transcriptional regulator [Pelagimonas phthalicica]TDS94972.1 AraC family transcriptional regulator [Pelagimonas phthalicica]SMX26502.1 Transposon Tn10 TetD protein [Pelagimonas phthalicica]